MIYCLKLAVEGFTVQLMWAIGAPLAGYDIVLGKPWLAKVNPMIDWQKGLVLPQEEWTIERKIEDSPKTAQQNSISDKESAQLGKLAKYCVSNNIDLGKLPKYDISRQIDLSKLAKYCISKITGQGKLAEYCISKNTNKGKLAKYDVSKDWWKWNQFQEPATRHWLSWLCSWWQPRESPYLPASTYWQEGNTGSMQ